MHLIQRQQHVYWMFAIRSMPGLHLQNSLQQTLLQIFISYPYTAKDNIFSTDNKTLKPTFLNLLLTAEATDKTVKASKYRSDTNFLYSVPHAVQKSLMVMLLAQMMYARCTKCIWSTRWNLCLLNADMMLFCQLHKHTLCYACFVNLENGRQRAVRVMFIGQCALYLS